MVAEHGLNIDAIKRLTGRIPLSEDDRAAKSCIELSVRGSLTDEERAAMQERFMNLAKSASTSRSRKTTSTAAAAA